MKLVEACLLYTLTFLLFFLLQDFLQKLKTYDKDNIPPKIISVIRATYLTNENFTPDVAKKASPAAEVRLLLNSSRDGVYIIQPQIS